MTKRSSHGNPGKSKKPEGPGIWAHLDPFYSPPPVYYDQTSYTASSTSQHSGAAGSSSSGQHHTAHSQHKSSSKSKHNSKTTEQTILSLLAGDGTYQEVASRMDPSATCAVIRQGLLDELGLGAFEQPYFPPYASVHTSDGAVEVRGVIKLEWSEVDDNPETANHGKSNFYTVERLKKADIYVPENFGQGG